jgi:hypothetical protein
MFNRLLHHHRATFSLGISDDFSTPPRRYVCHGISGRPHLRGEVDRFADSDVSSI